MDEKEVERTLQKIADGEGVSLNEIRREIEISIEAAQNDPDPKIQALWKSMPHKGGKITPEEFIAYITEIIKKDL